MRIVAAFLMLPAALTAPACSPSGDDSPPGTCTNQSCAIDLCVTQGYEGGRCDPTLGCVCIGIRDPGNQCVDATCASACRGYIGASGGACGADGRCRCTGGPTDGGADDGDAWIPPGRASAWGVVMGPGALFPVSGAVVYAARSGYPIEPIPEGNYCPRCLDLGSIPNTVSEADGYFNLAGLSRGDWTLVVQKGQFRRIRQIRIDAEDQTLEVPTDYTTLPSRHDPGGGDDVPRIAVALGSYDRMQDIFAKVGLAALSPDGTQALLDRTADLMFDVYDNGGGGFGSPYPSFGTLLTDPGRLAQYQIIFIPCSGSSNDSHLGNATVRENIRRWVADGGKWYVADWSYDFVEQVFPDAMDMYGDDSTIGAADTTPSYDGPGRVVDDDLAAWLNAMGHNPANVSFREIFDNICGLGTWTGVNEDGDTVSITPKRWAEGPQLQNRCGSGDYPYTVTFPYGCGRVLFTTYHSVGAMAGSHEGLYEQEKILFYLVMEIGVCTDEVYVE